MNDFPILFDPLDSDPAFDNIPLADEETHEGIRRLLEERKVSNYLLPPGGMIVHSGHIDTTAIALANMNDTPLVILGGAPGIGKTYHYPGGHMDDRMIHIQYEPMESWSLRDYRYRLNEPYIGDRRVHKGRKAQARINNRLARKARRAGR